MKSWEPDQVFDKADFPSKKRKQEEEQRGRTSAARQPAAGQGSEQKRAPAARGEVFSKENLGGRIKAWVPGSVQPGSKPAGTPPGKQPSAQKPATGSPSPARKPAGDSWIPDQDFSHADFPRKKPDASGQQDRPANGAPRSPSAADPSRAGAAETAAAGSALPEKFLRDLILMFPDNAVNQLRSWFWAKPGTPANDPTLAAVPGHERIYIILASAGKQVTEYIFTMMSPKERGQIMAILKKPYKPHPAQIHTVRNAFSSAIRGER